MAEYEVDVTRTVTATVFVEVDDLADLPNAVQAKITQQDSYIQNIDLQVTDWYQEGPITITSGGECGGDDMLDVSMFAV